MHNKAEMKSEPSATPMRLAKRIVAICNEELGAQAQASLSNWAHVIAQRLNKKAVRGIALLIAEETQPKWIECSERMPSEDHGDIGGKVLWRIDEDGEIHHKVASWDWVAWVAVPGVSWMPFPPGPK